jgi:homoserine kinase
MPDTSGRAIRIRVPASTSNLGSAFDAAGLALELYLRLEIERLESGPSRLEVSGLDRHLIPESDDNYVWQVMRDVAGSHGATLPPFRMRMSNEIPITKGLGSSAAATVAGAAAAGALCGFDLPGEEILEYATAREGHPDNAAPAVFGGLVSSISSGRVVCSRAEFPAGWTVVAVTPQFELETKKARAVLPEQVPYRDAVRNVQRAAFLMAQLVRGRSEGLREAMRDWLHQPYRSQLLPGLAEILDMPDEPGLLGVALSGAGSTVMAFADARASDIGARMQSIFAARGLTSEVRLLKADNRGLVCGAAERETS